MRERKTFEICGKLFKTKKAVIDAVHEELRDKPDGIAFTSALFSDLISKYHYRWAPLGIRPTLFRATTFGGDAAEGSYEMAAEIPGHGWMRCSWRKCLTPPTFESETKCALRRLIQDDLWSYRMAHYECSGAGPHRGPLNAHHIEPRFEEMVAAVEHLFSDADRKSWQHYVSPDGPTGHEDWRFPDGSAAVKAFLQLHFTSKLAVFCTNCHRQTHREERAT